MAIFRCPKCGWEQKFKGKEEYDGMTGETVFTIDENESYKLKSEPRCKKCNASLKIVGYNTFRCYIKVMGQDALDNYVARRKEMEAKAWNKYIAQKKREAIAKKINRKPQTCGV